MATPNSCDNCRFCGTSEQLFPYVEIPLGNDESSGYQVWEWACKDCLTNVSHSK